MASRASAEAVAAQRESMGIVEVSEHGDFSAGQIVELRGERGQFTVQSIRVYPDGTLRWLNLYGGPKGSEMHRSALEDRIKPRRRKVGK